ncbi:MAG TPA: DUF4349 domain-containing protein [Solirubrobacteraceae bacterium]|jgi:hypothetical protein|nr:DUF4349 domain-containing protein [Solirubrobacteraceae bacterium]
MRRRDVRTPEQEREIDALDRALAGDPVDADLRELEQLVRDARATAPEMTPAFAARLEHEVAEGFPAQRERPALRDRGRPTRRWLLLPAGASLAAVVVALAVVLGGGGNAARPTLAPATTQDAVPGESASGATAGSAALAPGASGVATQSGGSVAPARTRKVERSATLVLQAPRGRFAATTDAVIGTVARFDGIVASSQISAGDASAGEASFDLRIPTGQLDHALAALSKLGHVTERSQDLRDITASFSSAQSRLTDARAERTGLLRALASAATAQQVESLKARLHDAGDRIASIKRELAALGRRADLSRVDLTVRSSRANPIAGATGGGGHWTPRDAAGDALRVLEVLAGIALVALAVLIPVGLLGGALAFGIRVTRRRRRAAALDPI